MTSSNGPEPASSELHTRAPASVPTAKRVGQGLKFVVGAFGVGLPLIALCCEFTWQMCRDSLLDPLPTPLHAGMIALLITVNTALLFGAGQRWPWWGRVFSGVTLTTSTIYTIVFLPAAPIGLVGVVLYGLGLLVLSPALSLMAGLCARRLLAPVEVSRKPWLRHPSLLGAGMALVLFALPMIHPLVTYVYVKKSTSTNSSTAAAAVAALRGAGTERTLLDSCLPNSGPKEGSPLTLSFLLHGLPSGTVAATYYRVTGRTCSGQPTSSSAGLFGRGWHLTASADDPEGPGKDAELKLTSSRIDGTIDALAALGYLEWTWVVRNSLSAQREGVAEIALPPGAVVSRATLWINNEPREAAFAERHQAQAAYDKVVSRQRDPLLVMRTAEGTIQLKFFPVPAAGDMKLRIGITTPLQVTSTERAILGLPRIKYRNFAHADAHRVWVEAKTPFAYKSTQAQLDSGAYRLDRPLPAADLQKPGARLEFDLSGLPTLQWARDSVQPGRIVTQQLTPVTLVPPNSVRLVIDGSRSQGDALAAVGAALAAFPEGMPLDISFAGDEPETLMPLAPFDRSTAARMTQRLRELPTRGGADNATLLTWALEAMSPGAALVWVHGAQPVELGSLERLRQVIERSSPQPLVYELTTASGKNLVTQALYESGRVRSLDASLGVEAALRRLFQSWTGAQQFSFERELLAEGSEPPAAGAQTSDHLVRLWANDTVERLAASRRMDEAVKLAANYKLVTSVSGAVVLENAEQYSDAKLSAPGPEHLPSVPEPATVVLVVLVMLGSAAFLMTQRKRAVRALT